MLKPAIQCRRAPYAGGVAMLLFLLSAGCDRAKTADDYIKSAQTHRAAGDISAAIIDLKNALQKDPKNSAGRLLLAQYYLDLPDPISAEAELLRARQDGAEATSVAKPLARAELQMGKPEAALREADPSAAVPPALGADLQAVRADAYMALGQAANAKQALDSGAKLDAQSVDILASMARYALVTGDLASARKQLAEAQQQDPKSVALDDLEGTIAFAAQDFAASEAAYKKMLTAAPWSLVARLGLARAQIADRHQQDAIPNLAVVLKAVPNAPSANYLRALAAFQENDFTTAQTHIQRSLNAAKDSPPTLLLAGAISYALHQYEQANAYLSQYIYLVPQNVQARKLLGAAQLALGRSADAVKTLSPAADKASEDTQLLALIGTASARTGDLTAANRYFGKALEQQPGNAALRTEMGITQMALGQTDAAIAALEEASREDPTAVRADTALFINYFRQKDYDKALAVAERIKTSHPDQPAGFDFAGAVQLAKADEAGARAQFMKARELRVGDPIASRSLAALSIRSGDVAGAAQYYDEEIQANPKDVTAAISLAGLQEQQGKREEAKGTLQKAIERNPDNPAPATMLGRVDIVERKYQDALNTIDPALARNPKDPALLEVAGRAQLALGNTAAALGTFGRLTDVLPQMGAGHRYLAETYLVANQPDSALAEAQKSIAADPKNPLAKLTLARAFIATRSYADAGKVLDGLAADYPREPTVAELRGTVALAQNRAGDAVASYQTALASSDNGPSRVRLAGAQVRAGQTADAEKTLLQWLDAHPDDPGPRELLGDIYLSGNQLDDARAQYEAVLKAAPNTAAAENNLAWILYQKGDASAALDHARHAAGLAPDDPRVLDTYGIVLLQNKFAADAVETLQKASGSAPANPSIQFHFAQALAGAGDNEKARGVLRTLLGRSQAFDEREQAQKLLQELGS